MPVDTRRQMSGEPPAFETGHGMVAPNVYPGGMARTNSDETTDHSVRDADREDAFIPAGEAGRLAAKHIARWATLLDRLK
ncbi:hypothetical protein [Mycobacterium marinum]|uniref:hypothetical protein n=1 Tax=Mycobacterium marinum TaxID=1781 RepID=UPI0019214C55|nr:hypothetical protein [Mycobacterium marinum]QQW36302.1 hypothetical protein HXW97_22560 [Mycobacterium marinum]